MALKSEPLARLQYWYPALFVAALISFFSTHYFTEENTREVIVPVLHWLLPWAGTRLLHHLHIAVRKAAHFTEFGVFSILIFRGLRGGRPGWKLRWALATLLIAAAYASLDEWHQSFVPLRHPAFRDVALDTCGAFFSQLGVWAYATKKKDVAHGEHPGSREEDET